VAHREADATRVDNVTYAFFWRHCLQLGALTRVLAATPPEIPLGADRTNLLVLSLTGLTHNGDRVAFAERNS
jgi:hypothetical protein